MNICSLRAGEVRLDVDPVMGGCVRAFSYAGQDVLRPCPDSQNVLDAAAFPMVPFTGRIAHARFDWDGKTITLPRNFLPEPHAIHGTGWQTAWTVEDQSQTRLVLTHSPQRSAWPWACTARQVFRLDETGLSLEMSVRNADTTDMPAGLGWHPYFVRGDAELSVTTKAMWANDESGVSARRVTPPHGLDGSQSRRVRDLNLDNAFDTADIAADVSWPERGLSARLTASAIFRNLVVYTPDADHFCVEPASHAPDALNTHPGGSSDMERLRPGEELSGWVRLAVSRHD